MMSQQLLPKHNMSDEMDVTQDVDFQLEDGWFDPKLLTCSPSAIHLAKMPENSTYITSQLTNTAIFFGTFSEKRNQKTGRNTKNV